MTKKPYVEPEKKQEQPPAQPQPPMNAQEQQILSSLPKEAREKLEAIKVKLQELEKALLKKFDKYIMGIALLPPPKPAEGKKVDLQQINVLILVDDADSKNLNKQELKDKLHGIITKMASDIDSNIIPQTLILSELWQSCFDAKYELLQLMAMAAPVFERGMLSAIKIAEIHKSMVLKKFEKYIVSYVLFGSLTRGTATAESDIDVAIVIDDTDVKKMTRAELKDKLRAIIVGMGLEAGDITGIKNKLNIQVYILTDFWDSVKEANPVIFTILRDGIPFYDRGIFMPWKQLLKMGKIKPSAEAIDMFMSSGEQMLKRVSFKLKDIGMEDIYYALLTPSQAALMLHGVPPPDPRETAKLMRDIFVKKEKILEEKFVHTLEKAIETRKKLEHGEKKEITGKEIDELMGEADKFLARIKRLFTQIEKMREEEDAVHIYDNVVTVIRDVMALEGVEKVKDNDILETFEKEMVTLGKIPAKFLRMLEEIIKAKKDYDEKKLSKIEVDKIKKDSHEFIKFMVEYMQRKRGRELERTKIRVKHGERYGEVILLDDTAFIIHDIDHEEKEITRAKLKPNGGLGTVEKSSLEELEKHLAKVEIPSKVFIKEPIFEDLKNIFGKDVEILLNY